MSKIEELIAELCPNGVEYKMLGEVFVQFSGMGGVSNKWANEGNCRFIDYMNAYKHVSIDVADLPFATVKKLDQNILKQGDVLFTSASETPDECAISSVIEDKIEDGIFLDDHLFGLRLNEDYNDKVSPSYLKYAFRAKSFRSQMKKAVRGVTRFYVSKPDFMRLKIPVPPLEVQREIARILDNFTFLSAELSAELQARKKQYDYYSGKMFPSVKDKDIEWVELGDVATVTKLAGFEFSKYVTYSKSGDIIALRGLNVKDGHLVLDDVKYIDNSDLSMLSRSKLHCGDMLFTYVGTVGQVALVDAEEKYYLAPNVALVRVNKEFLPKYMMYYFMTWKFKREQILKLLQSSSMQNIPMEKIRKFKLPKVSLENQQQVVAYLDRFDELCSNITQGLPLEIEIRKKQYEYYRDKLLTFKEKN